MNLEERVAKLKENEPLKNFIELIVLFPMRFRSRRLSRLKRNERIEALKSVRNVLIKTDAVNAGNFRKIFNLAFYALLFDQDLAYFTDAIVQAVGDRRRRFMAKNEAILLYEVAQDFPHMLGKDFRQAVSNIGAPSNIISDLNNVSSDLNRFWQQHKNYLGNIRNNLAAHREKDSLKYSEMLESLNPLAIMKIAAEFSQLLERLVATIVQLMQLTADPNVVARDIMSS
ncbi:MAG: hypothetical protein WBD27_01190 [Pyrinomonadaceae bacterium]